MHFLLPTNLPNHGYTQITIMLDSYFKVLQHLIFFSPKQGLVVTYCLVYLKHLFLIHCICITNMKFSEFLQYLTWNEYS